MLEAGVFPLWLKQSYVVPIFKSGNREDVSNYRPIVIQPSLAKYFEGIILDGFIFNFNNVVCECVEGMGFLKVAALW